MRIGNLEILIRSTGILPAGHGSASSLPTADLSGVFAVSDQEAWWRAVHQIVDQVESWSVELARARVNDANLCLNAVGLGEGAAMVRKKLIAARAAALKKGLGV